MPRGSGLVAVCSRSRQGLWPCDVPPDSDVSYQAFYINLDRSTDRRAQMEQALLALPGDIPVSRFSGVEVSNGQGSMSAAEVGCYLSHQGILERAGDQQHTLILEDDLIFSSSVARGLELAHRILEDSKFDLLFLGQTVQYNDIGMHQRLMRVLAEMQTAAQPPEFACLPAPTFYRWGSYAYAVNRSSAKRIAQFVQASLRSKQPVPVDQLYRNLIAVRKINAAVLFPHLARVNPRFPSTMAGRSFELANKYHVQMTGVYMKGSSLNEETDRWRDLLSRDPNPHALAIARLIYEAILERS